MRRSIILRFTWARFAWLDRLEREGVAVDAPRGVVGFECRRLGLAQFVVGHQDHHLFGHALTRLGWEQLQEWRRLALAGQ